ncbi:hypothetical protein ElyMa_003941100 [Elysia marginata]|uniref:Uncharacterized protein n=1 Tax=Elysia marginata TaxID=1093978 RepID=A0AAV4FS26_9GAST|nr:hypothetical protein ElyMa_003941100 [Elysia marginata]
MSNPQKNATILPLYHPDCLLLDTIQLPSLPHLLRCPVMSSLTPFRRGKHIQLSLPLFFSVLATLPFPDGTVAPLSVLKLLTLPGTIKLSDGATLTFHNTYDFSRLTYPRGLQFSLGPAVRPRPLLPISVTPRKTGSKVINFTTL